MQRRSANQFGPLATLLVIVFSTGLAANEGLMDWYESNAKTPPYPQMRAEMQRDKDVFQRLRIPAILAILSHELSEGRWTDLAQEDRKRLLDILHDPKLQLVYTGKQSLLAHSSGAQTIDKNLVKLHQEGLFRRGEPLPPHQIARHLLHELAHVYHLRHNWAPRPGRTKEWWPEELEKQLSARNFASECAAQMDRFLTGDKVDYGYFGGEWVCPLRGVMKLTQGASQVAGSFSGFPDGGGHWGKGLRKGGTIEGSVQGPVMTIIMANGDGTFSKATAKLLEGGRKFEGDWTWFKTKENLKKDERRLGSGKWNGHR